MEKQISKHKVEIWGGMECTINRVHESYMDQLSLSGHYTRALNDIERFAALGIKSIRYPVLWEKHQPEKNQPVNWSSSSETLNAIRQAGIEPIVGLVHHGSGPSYVNFFDGTFEHGLEQFAAKVAQQYPWVQYYTPINEPLTTARFCGLYGLWYPHQTTSLDFLRILFAECKATVLAMQAIRKINPEAKLVQTEDLGKIHSTPALKYQADFENKRRWLSYDLLCGKVNKQHELWQYLVWEGITKEELLFFVNNPCPPDILGVNHYITSERWLDERVENFPPHTHGGNGRHVYADVEAVRAGKHVGPKVLLKEAWDRYNMPIAVTEVHLHCTREEQMRWLHHVWQAANELLQEGVNIKAITAWALLGSFDWNSLLTIPAGVYEAGVFDVRGSALRSTVLAKMVETYARGDAYNHPVLEEEGWWNKPCAIYYKVDEMPLCKDIEQDERSFTPLLIIGKTGTLGRAFARVCSQRNIPHVLLGRDDITITDPTDVERMLAKYKPWAIVNATGYVRVDDAEHERDNCFLINTTVPQILSAACSRHGIQFITFSSDLVFDGRKNNPYIESDSVAPLNVYGQSKAMAEAKVSTTFRDALIIRTSAFFGPWDRYNFVYHTLNTLKSGQEFIAANDMIISPTYVPDLVNVSLDLLLDGEKGIWNLSNKGSLSWSTLAGEVAERGGYTSAKVKAVTSSEMNFIASRPSYSALATEKGYELPSWDNALNRYFREQEMFAA